MKNIDPKSLGIKSKIKLKETDQKQIVMTIDRKSRIIMKDGALILNRFDILKRLYKNYQFVLETTAPVCSKTESFLVEHGIEVIRI